MEKQNSRQPIYQIPRYLGLRKITKEKDEFQVSLGFAAKNQIELTLDQESLGLLLACQEPVTVADLQKKIKGKKTKIEKGLKAFMEAKVIVEQPSVPESLKRYDRHLLYYQLSGVDPVEAQKKISRSTIALIGAGGIGNWASLTAIGAGFKEIRLIDFDTIELSNLTRQVLFKEDDVGMMKIRVAARELKARNHNTKIVAHDMKVSSARQLAKVLEGVDFVILSADRPENIHDWVDEICIANGIPYLNLGYRDDEGVIGPMTVRGKTSCYQCFKPKPDKNVEQQKSSYSFEHRYQAPSFGPMNAVVSSIGVNEMIKYLIGMNAESYSTELAVDLHTLEIRRTPYARDNNCWHCGK